jgi:hypothetical protein
VALSQLSPLGGLNRMARQAARREAEGAPDVDDDLGGELDLERIFKQGFSDSYEGFTAQYDAYARALAQLENEFKAGGQAPSEDSSTPAKKSSKP